MCVAAALAPLIGAGGVAAGAAGAGAGLLSTIGTIVSIGGALMQGVQAKQASEVQAKLITQQAAQEAQLTTTADQRKREEFRLAGSQQMAELAARGVSLDSPTALFLGRTLAQEMAFDSQAIRSDGAARQAEMSNSAMMVRAQGQSAMLKGTLGAASGLLTAAPDLWPGFMRGGE